MVPTSGWLIGHLGGYGPAFWGTSVSFMGAAIWAFFISPVYFTAPRNQEKTNPNLRAAIRKVMGDRALLGFAIAMIAIGLLNSGVQQFENVFLSQLGASKQLISIAGILSAIVELPFMLLSDRIIRRAGPHRIFLVAILLTLLQRAAILIQPSIAMIMIMRFVGGIGFSFYTISFVGMINSRTQAHETGTVLALFTVTLAGLVNIIASPLAGAIYDAIGARWLYAFSVSGYAIAMLSLWLTRPVDEGSNHA
jgi:PPP family 3-phenylpropionic acid transporter